ncbi:helix-turn-helix domain-containing protein [Streptomyces sp. NBC_00105]|uniref:helix-turn-helix domain-containing protein n=1 Tax=Streptomyces sp. NBC_00105 TaxID=2903622 RepID=UPI003245E42C
MIPRFSPAKAVARREDLFLSRSDVARLTGKTYAAVRSWELGRYAPLPSALRSLAAALECKPLDLCLTPTKADVEPEPAADGPVTPPEESGERGHVYDRRRAPAAATSSPSLAAL